MSNCEEIVTSEENEDLIKPFSENEINVAVWSCYEEGATGPDGLSFLIYHKFWESRMTY